MKEIEEEKFNDMIDASIKAKEMLIVLSYVYHCHADSLQAVIEKIDRALKEAGVEL